MNDPGHRHGYYDKFHQSGKYGYQSGKSYTVDVIKHKRTSDSTKTGISITIDGVSGARTSTETRPKNMHVVYIMKVC